MRKVVSLLLILTMLFVFVGCGSKNTETKEKENTESNKGTETTQSVPSDKKPSATAGTELSTFIGNYMDAKSVVWEEMSKKFEEEKNDSFIFGAIGFAFADLILIDVSFYDLLSLDVGGLFKGTLMFSNIEAWKKENGGIIEFGYDYTYKEDKNMAQKGDLEVAKGKFDTKTNSLYYEKYNERSGKIQSKYVVEITKNNDNSYSSQVYSMTLRDSSYGFGENKVYAYFTWFDDKDMFLIEGEKPIGSGELIEYSIFGKKNVKPEDMVRNMEVKQDISFIKGVASYN